MSVLRCRSAAECRIAIQISKQDSPAFFVFLTDESQAEREAAHCIFFIINLLILVCHPMQCVCKFDQFLNQGYIDFALFRAALDLEPGKFIAACCFPDLQITIPQGLA